MNQEHLFVESLPKSVHKSVNWKINRAKASIRATIFARNPITKGVTSTIENISMFYQIEFHWSSYHIITYNYVRDITYYTNLIENLYWIAILQFFQWILTHAFLLIVYPFCFKNILWMGRTYNAFMQMK